MSKTEWTMPSGYSDYLDLKMTESDVKRHTYAPKREPIPMPKFMPKKNYDNFIIGKSQYSVDKYIQGVKPRRRRTRTTRRIRVRK